MGKDLENQAIPRNNSHENSPGNKSHLNEARDISCLTKRR